MWVDNTVGRRKAAGGMAEVVDDGCRVPGSEYGGSGSVDHRFGARRRNRDEVTNPGLKCEA
jgi:hypothetical protein